MNFKVLLTSLMIAAPLFLLAGPPPPAPQAVPVTGGVALLVGAAAVYGAKKLRDKRKDQE